MYRFKYFFYLLFFLPILAFTQEWKLEKNNNDIKVYTRKINGSSYKEFRAEMIVKSTLAGVIKIIDDISSYPKWMYNCVEAKVLKKISSTEGYAYTVVKAPWPVSDRDDITHYIRTQDPKTKEVTIKLSGDKNYLPLKDGKVRVEKINGIWTITPLKSGMVQIVYRLYFEPGGMIPASLANTFVTEGPYFSFQNIKKLLCLKEFCTYKNSEIIELN